MVIDQFLFISAAKNYWVTKENRNCPTNVITGEKSWCEEAANDFGVKYVRGGARHYDLPAGCFFDLRNNEFNFNEETDPNEITLGTYGYKGVCRSGIIV